MVPLSCERSLAICEDWAVEKLLLELPSRKTAGDDGIYAELMKYAARSDVECAVSPMVDVIRAMCFVLIMAHCTPSSWNVANVALIWKKKGRFKSSAIDVLHGLLQGTVLAPLLFNIAINALPKLLREQYANYCYSIGTNQINSLLFADDTFLIVCHTVMQQVLDTCFEWGGRCGIKWS
ncbi:UNVERIFIED_CONTAM: hypothetical protein HDU68_007000, partial [Siphonaria sp. JEL0065]